MNDTDGVQQVIAYFNLPHPVANHQGLTVDDLLPPIIRDPEEIAQRVRSSRDALGNLINTEGSAIVLLVFLNADANQARGDGRNKQAFSGSTATLKSVRSAVESMFHDQVYFAGSPFVEFQVADTSRRDLRRLSPLVIGVLTLCSALLLCSIAAAAINLLIAVAGVLLLLGGMAWAEEPLTIVSTTLPVMMVAFGGAFGVHLLAGYQHRSGDRESRVEAMWSELRAPVMLSETTTAFGFLALIVLPQVPMQRFAIVAATGVVMLLILAYAVIPAMLSIFPGSWIPYRPSRNFTWKRSVFGLVALPLLLVSIPGLMRLRADVDMNQIFAEGTETERAQHFFSQQFSGSVFLQVAITGDLSEPVVLRRIRDLCDDIERLEGVVEVRSVVDSIGILNHALGGRKGIPESRSRAQTVLTHLVAHPAASQLISKNADRALLHIKLLQGSGQDYIKIVNKLEDIVASYREEEIIFAADTKHSSVHAVQRAAIEAKISQVLGQATSIDPNWKESVTETSELLAKLEALRDQIFDPNEGAVEEAISPEAIARIQA